MNPGIIFFMVAILCLFIRLIYWYKWKRGIDRWLGEYIDRDEFGETVWRYYPDIKEALDELDIEYPGYKEIK